MQDHIKHLPETVKHIGDVTGIGAVIIAWLDIINPLLETGIIILTAAWMILRIQEARLSIKEKQDKE